MSVDFALPAIIVAGGLIVVPAAIARRQWVLAVGYCTAGAGVALQSPAVYRVVDPALGGLNWTNLAYHLLTVAGIGAFLLLVLTTNPHRDRRAATRRVVVATAVAWLLEGLLFTVGTATSRWGQADAHLTEVVTTPLFLAYAAVLWGSLAALAVAAIVVQRAETRGRRWSVAKLGTALVTLGSIAALCWCVNAFVVAALAVVHRQEPGAADTLGQALALAAGGAVFLGLAATNVTHVTGWVRAAALDVSTRPLWRRAVAAAPEVSLAPHARLSLGARPTLYRHWVEIEDAVRLGRLPLTDREREQIATMERMFAPATTPGGAASPVARR